jgi:DDE superfamily endonuclease
VRGCGDRTPPPRVLVIDDTGDRKDGTKTAHVARQYLGSVGKTDNGIVCVTSLWADGRCYWPLHVVPYTPASRLAKGQSDPGFRTKPQLAAALVAAARLARIPFRAVVADCFYGDNTGFVEALGAGVAFVLALKPRKGIWAPDDEPHTPVEAARELGWGGPGRPGPWRRVIRRFRDGHTETWWAADAVLGGWGPDRHHRLVVATTDPATLPRLTTWYLLTNLACPASRRAQQAQLAEIVAAYGLRNWVEQGYKQVKDELGWGTSRSEVTGRSGGTGRWCAARSASAGTPARPKRWRTPAARARRPWRRRRPPSRRPRGGPCNVSIQTATTAPAGIGVSWPQALRRVRAWLAPWVWLQRCWRGWSTSPPPPPLQQALDWVMAGRPIYLYLPP